MDAIVELAGPDCIVSGQITSVSIFGLKIWPLDVNLKILELVGRELKLVREQMHSWAESAQSAQSAVAVAGVVMQAFVALNDGVCIKDHITSLCKICTMVSSVISSEAFVTELEGYGASKLTVDCAVKFLKLVNKHFLQAELFHFCASILELVIPVYKSRRAYRQLAKCHALLIEIHESILEQKFQFNSLMPPTWVGFCDSRQVKADELQPGVCYLQITAVDPLMEDEDLGSRRERIFSFSAESVHARVIDCFLFDTPVTKNGKTQVVNATGMIEAQTAALQNELEEPCSSDGDQLRHLQSLQRIIQGSVAAQGPIIQAECCPFRSKKGLETLDVGLLGIDTPIGDDIRPRNGMNDPPLAKKGVGTPNADKLDDEGKIVIPLYDFHLLEIFNNSQNHRILDEPPLSSDSKNAMSQLSKSADNKARDAPGGVPRSKLSSSLVLEKTLGISRFTSAKTSKATQGSQSPRAAWPSCSEPDSDDDRATQVQTPPPQCLELLRHQGHQLARRHPQMGSQPTDAGLAVRKPLLCYCHEKCSDGIWNMGYVTPEIFESLRKASMVIDGELLMSRPCPVSKGRVRQLSRAVGKSREAPVGVPRSKQSLKSIDTITFWDEKVALPVTLCLNSYGHRRKNIRIVPESIKSIVVSGLMAMMVQQLLYPVGFYSLRLFLDINSFGTFTMCHEALENLKKGPLGRRDSSGGGLMLTSVLLYIIRLLAVDATARNLAFEWGTGYNIRLNRIASGPIGDTPGFSREKKDIAMAALYFASDAGKFINGASMVVDGGLWMSCPTPLPKDTVRWLSRAVEKRNFDIPYATIHKSSITSSWLLALMRMFVNKKMQKELWNQLLSILVHGPDILVNAAAAGNFLSLAENLSVGTVMDIDTVVKNMLGWTAMPLLNSKDSCPVKNMLGWTAMPLLNSEDSCMKKKHRLIKQRCIEVKIGFEIAIRRNVRRHATKERLNRPHNDSVSQVQCQAPDIGPDLKTWTKIERDLMSKSVGIRGYKRFFRRAALESSDYLKDDCLKINCTVGVVVSAVDCPRLHSIKVPESDIGAHLACCWIIWKVQILLLRWLVKFFMLTLFDKFASLEVVDFGKRKRKRNKLNDVLFKLKIKLLSADTLVNDAEEKQLVRGLLIFAKVVSTHILDILVETEVKGPARMDPDLAKIPRDIAEMDPDLAGMPQDIIGMVRQNEIIEKDIKHSPRW
ncbi:hypothetical protein FNV43_RR21568 [Rhamnella rubrinervis]|uniref:Uncharacterized protein n=1 Tax=Rhamnella rubrinervis TaxID=2594499 RepID=A0A8K0E0Z3_9ROSA|nr:hypothetical protein FNV43_RR21568 [Rhamnella rubrinervis]